jgi:hypothetical protein
MAVIAFSTASAFKLDVPATLTAADPLSATISVDELYRHVDMRSLPELEIRDLY